MLEPTSSPELFRNWGMGREDVVAVVTERNLGWMAAVLAVFKAGGVYLPIEPHFPGERISATLLRSDCKLVLTESGSTATLDEALESLATGGNSESRIAKHDIADAYGQGYPSHDLLVDVRPDQLAYIYFTSGSTGEPKGCDV